MAAPGKLREFVQLIREHHDEHGSTVDEITAVLSKLLGSPVHPVSIGRILNGDSYPDEPGPIRKKRPQRGKPRSSILSPAQVTQARLEYWTDPESVAVIAARYDIRPLYLWMLATGRARANIPMPEVPEEKRVKRMPRPQPGRGAPGELNPNAVFTWDAVHEMRELYWKDGVEPGALADKEAFDTSDKNVWMICNNWRWKLPQEEFTAKYMEGTARAERRGKVYASK